MAEGYWCPRCEEFVLTRFDMFNHLHFGMCRCYVCMRCGGMVYFRDRKGVPAGEDDYAVSK